MQVGVTGANGFVGQALCRHLKLAGHTPIAITRKPLKLPGITNEVVLSLTNERQLEGILSDCQTVVHLAARAHAATDRRKSKDDLLNVYRQANVIPTIALTRAAAKAGTKRIVYVSSIKVNGEATFERPFTADSSPNPSDPYGISKNEAEQQLKDIALQLGIESTVIRPALIYGTGSQCSTTKGNLASLRRAVELGLPLPLKSIRNRRDLVSLDNLCDLITLCLKHPKASGATFLAADGISRTTAEIAQLAATGISARPRILPFPPKLLELSALLLGKKQQIQRLLGNLEVDISDTCETLGWQPTPPKTYV